MKAIDVIRHFELHLDDESDFASIVFGSPVEFPDIQKASDAWGHPLPNEYIEFMTTYGPFHILDHCGDDYFKLLHPLQSIEMMDWMKDYVDDDDFGEEEEELLAAKNEQNARSQMYPFQYISTYVHDFYCFYKKKSKEGQAEICSIYHDDYELAHYIDKHKPDDQYSFEQHIIDLINGLSK